jgi:arylsulfatase A-like enzyme
LTRPNVLFLVVDDLRTQLGCYGEAQMRTPHIDRLAAEGLVFERAYCQVPVCGASRASFLTGRRPTRDRFTTYYARADEDLPEARTLPEHFREHGYAAVSLGKVFHDADDAAGRSWTAEPWLPKTKGNWRDYLLEESQAAAADNDGKGPPYECADVADNAYKDGQVADRALEELRRLAGEDDPFFLAVGFFKPHLPFNAPKRYWDLYDREAVPLAANPFAPAEAPPEAMHNWAELRAYFDMPQEGPLPDEMARTLVHGYYAATSYTDAQVGRVLGELDRLGLADGTVVVLWGDHGWHLGEHGLWCKHCNFHHCLNAPLLVRAPGVAGGRRTAALTEFLDVYPTLAELAGLPAVDGLDGTSFVPLLSEPDRPWKEAAYSRYQAGDSVKTGRHLYTEWTDEAGAVTARMLYDHTSDPAENVNVSERPEEAATVEQLSAALRARRSG